MAEVLANFRKLSVGFPRDSSAWCCFLQTYPCDREDCWTVRIVWRFSNRLMYIVFVDFSLRDRAGKLGLVMGDGDSW